MKNAKMPRRRIRFSVVVIMLAAIVLNALLPLSIYYHITFRPGMTVILENRSGQTIERLEIAARSPDNEKLTLTDIPSGTTASGNKKFVTWMENIAAFYENERQETVTLPVMYSANSGRNMVVLIVEEIDQDGVISKYTVYNSQDYFTETFVYSLIYTARSLGWLDLPLLLFK